MTIITKTGCSDKKKVDEAVLVNAEDIPHVDEDKLDLEAGAPTIIQTRKKRKLTNTATFFVVAIGLLFLMLGALGAIRLYQQLSKRNVYHSVIDLPIDHPIHEGSGWNDPYHHHEEHQNTFNQPMAFPQYLHEEFHIDIEKEVYEQINVPQPPTFTHGRRGRFIHDFSLNKTGIVDIDGRRCFVMPLDRTRIFPPRTLFEFMIKLKAKYYTVDTKMVRETMRVVQPPIEDYQSLGYFIARDCVGFKTYRLEKAIVDPVYKRSTDAKESLDFVEFAGTLMKYSIINY